MITICGAVVKKAVIKKAVIKIELAFGIFWNSLAFGVYWLRASEAREVLF